GPFLSPPGSVAGVDALAAELLDGGIAEVLLGVDHQAPAPAVDGPGVHLAGHTVVLAEALHHALHFGLAVQLNDERNHGPTPVRATLLILAQPGSAPPARAPPGSGGTDGFPGRPRGSSRPACRSAGRARRPGR